ncbi:MAG: BolA family protein [Myxococcota bacterium]|nr:BolA family protein [Myxococcota bacterium]
MALQIVNQGPPPDVITQEIREAITSAIEGADVTVDPRGPGHFEITVVSRAFEGRSRVQQHQLVYGAITELMSGPNAPVHAIDKLECKNA